MSKVLSPIGDDPPSVPVAVPDWTATTVDTSRPLASTSMAAPLTVSSLQMLELLSAEPPQGVLKKVSPTGGVGGFLVNIPLSQRIAPVLPKEAEEPVAACNIGSVSDAGDISPLEVSDTEDDNSDDDDIQALDILIPMNTGPPGFTPCVDEVLELARKTSGMDPGAPGFLGALQDATTVLWNTLDADDQEDYAQAAKEWSQDAPPAHVQSRMASSLCKQIVQDFQRQLFKTCGIHTLVLTTYNTEDNDLSIGLDDVENILDDGISFLKFCPDWKTAPLWERWTQFGIHRFSQVDDLLEEDPVEVLTKPNHSKMITTKIPISMDMSGCPELPTVTMLD
ncbi:hypothetical protein EI94DRAFT_1807172 [Lactarius quietus]|nr:hypothetical protein EI94DRAFT_1807172 [Lactarius quietus]